MKRWVRIEHFGAHSFVDIETGEVLKPAGFKTPAITKVKRGNIFNEFNGLKNIGPYGVLYSHELKKFEPSEVWAAEQTRKRCNLEKRNGNEQDENDNVCWHEDLRDRCPKNHRDDDFIIYGRCKSGKRWFWSAASHFWKQKTGDVEVYGWADTEEQALSDVRDAVYSMADGRSVIAGRKEKYTSMKLQEINAVKKAARPAPDVSDSRAVEYLYDYWGSKRYRITKRTKERVYYVEQEPTYRNAGEWKSEFAGWVDSKPLRTRFTPKTKVFEKRLKDYEWRDLFLEPRRPETRTRESSPDLRKLKAEMAAAHPDKGGTCAAFREARERYVIARELVKI